MYQEINWLMGIAVGVVLIIVGYGISFVFLPKKTDPKKNENPDVTLAHLKYLYLESYTLIIGGLFLVALSILLSIV